MRSSAEGRREQDSHSLRSRGEARGRSQGQPRPQGEEKAQRWADGLVLEARQLGRGHQCCATLAFWGHEPGDPFHRGRLSSGLASQSRTPRPCVVRRHPRICRGDAGKVSGAWGGCYGWGL